MKAPKLCILTLLLSAGCTWAQLQEKTLVVVGHGPTAEAARRAALVEAVRQANEALVSSEQDSSSRSLEDGKVQENINTMNGKPMLSEKVEKNAGFTDITSANISIISKGVVSHYKILREEAIGTKEWTSTLEVSCPYYSTPLKGRESLRSIAVDRVISSYSSNEQNEAVPRGDLETSLSQAITEKLTQSRKFRVLDRMNSDSLQREAEFLSKKGRMQETARFGRAAGADYVLVARIRECQFTRTEQNIQLLNTSEVDASFNLVIDYRLIDTATAEIRMANTLQIRGGQELADQLGVAPSQNPFIAFARHLGAKASLELLENVYPVLVIDVRSPSEIYLNQGGDRFRIGDELYLYSKQKSVRDPATQSMIKLDGGPIGQVRVRAVRAKFVIAELIAGDLGNVKVGSLARPTTLSAPTQDEQTIRSRSKFK
jgi:curli biogenesis system outer membrane secretion channel CsgG